MTIQQAIKELEFEWMSDDGFFNKLKAATLDREGYERVKRMMWSIEIPGEETKEIDRYFVHLVHQIPPFMTHQGQRMIKYYGDDGVSKIVAVVNQLANRLLTYPYNKGTDDVLFAQKKMKANGFDIEDPLEGLR